DARNVLRVARDLSAEGPDELMIMSILGTEATSGMEVSVVSACYQGPIAEGDRLLAPLRTAGTPLIDFLRPLSYTEMQATFPLMPFGLRHYWKGHFLTRFPDEAIDESVDRYNARPKPSNSTLLFEFIHGAPTRVPSDAMAFNHRDARQNVSALGIWEDPAQDADQI